MANYLIAFFLCVFVTGTLAGRLNVHEDEYMHSHPRKSEKLMSKINSAELGATFWKMNAQETLKAHVERKENKNIAKNVIMFLGDGMSIPTLSATRMYLGNENTVLSFEEFPHTALSKTYCVDAQTADSACSATAYLCGVKANDGTIGVTAEVPLGDCEQMQNKNFHVTSIAEWAQDEGKATGIVTTTRITHASPAGTYAHTAHRDWENDGKVKEAGADPTKCLDIATQLIKNKPGNAFKVILGGGRGGFVPSTEIDDEGTAGWRSDGINLIETWKDQHSAVNASYIWNKQQLDTIDYGKTDFLLGLFERDHCQYHLDVVDKGVEDMEPSLTDMVEAAILMLEKDDNGYFLFVEGGRIDHAHHDSRARKALDETAEFSKAIQAAVDLTNEEDTLIVVTADHAHTMSQGGYPTRGNDIFGFAMDDDDNDFTDKLPISTLTYANGKGYSTHIKPEEGRQDYSTMDNKNLNFYFPSAAPRGSETHGGDDVAVFARGPWSHLFTGTIEQNVIPHIMAYASRIGDGLKANGASILISSGFSLLVSLVVITLTRYV